MLAQTVNTLIRLLQKEQSDQGIHCLPFMKLLREVYLTRSQITIIYSINMVFRQGVQIYRVSTVLLITCIRQALEQHGN